MPDPALLGRSRRTNEPLNIGHRARRKQVLGENLGSRKTFLEPLNASPTLKTRGRRKSGLVSAAESNPYT